MRRVELARAVRNVLRALRESGVMETLVAAARAPTDDAGSLALLSALRGYTVLAAGFGEAERRVIQAMELGGLDDPAWWARVVGGDPAERARAASVMVGAIRAAGASLPRMVGLLAPEPGLEPGLASLEVAVIADERQRSTPLRLMTTLESVWLLYDLSATLRGLPADTLSVASCDSGNELSFDFVGLAPAVEGVKEILVSVWDRVVFFRGRQADARADVIERSMPVVNQIARMREAGELGPEQAELMRRRAVAGVRKFLEAGCTIPEIEASESHAARDLLAPSPKLLSGAPAR